jgi:hypothetical protein
MLTLPSKGLSMVELLISKALLRALVAHEVPKVPMRVVWMQWS